MNGAGWRLAAERAQDRKCLLDPLFGQEVAFMCFIVEDVAENSIRIHVSILVCSNGFFKGQLVTFSGKKPLRQFYRAFIRENAALYAESKLTLHDYS